MTGQNKAVIEGTDVVADKSEFLGCNMLYTKRINCDE